MILKIWVKQKLIDLILLYSDIIEKLSMNFITEKVNYGIMESLSQQVLFNTEQRNNKFLTLLILWMLDFTEGYAFKIFLFRNCDTWKPSCFNGTNLVLDVNLNKWKSSDDDCYLKLIPDNICIDLCNINI